MYKANFPFPSRDVDLSLWAVSRSCKGWQVQELIASPVETIDCEGSKWTGLSLWSSELEG